MATAIRLTETAVAGIGEFGRTVHDRLVGDGARSVDPAATDLGGAGALVVISWRPERTDHFRQLATDHRVGWFSVFIDHPYLIAGPWVEPSGGGCHDCYRFRREQHDTGSATRRTILSAYAADDDLGVGGHLPHHVRFAEAMVRQAIWTRRTGHVTTWPLSGGPPLATRLLPRHGCRHCATTQWGDPRLSGLIDDLKSGADG